MNSELERVEPEAGGSAPGELGARLSYEAAFDYVAANVSGYLRGYSRDADQAARSSAPWQQDAYLLSAAEREERYRDVLAQIADGCLEVISCFDETFVNPVTGEGLSVPGAEEPPTDSPIEYRRWMLEQDHLMQEALMSAGGRAREAKEAAEDLVLVWVCAARAAGMTWKQVARLTGHHSPQAVQQKYRDL